MKIARIRTPDGVVSGRYADGAVTADEGEFALDPDSELLQPCSPSAVYCVGRNFTETLDQMDYDRPEAPDFFIKPPAALTGPGRPIRYPEWTDDLTYAGELAAVIGKQCRNVDVDAVPDIVQGYTVLNDVDALDQQGRTARKAFHTSGPLGPWIETDVDPNDIDMKTVINGERRQSANTGSMLFDPYEVVSFLSQRFTLHPGDAIAFGSPANPGTIEPGDVIEITYHGVGTLRNTVIADD